MPYPVVPAWKRPTKLLVGLALLDNHIPITKPRNTHPNGTFEDFCALGGHQDGHQGDKMLGNKIASAAVAAVVLAASVLADVDPIVIKVGGILGELQRLGSD